MEILHQKNIYRSVQIDLRNPLSRKINIKSLALKMYINYFIILFNDVIVSSDSAAPNVKVIGG